MMNEQHLIEQLDKKRGECFALAAKLQRIQHAHRNKIPIDYFIDETPESCLKAYDYEVLRDMANELQEEVQTVRNAHGHASTFVGGMEYAMEFVANKAEGVKMGSSSTG